MLIFLIIKALLLGSITDAKIKDGKKKTINITFSCGGEKLYLSIIKNIKNVDDNNKVKINQLLKLKYFFFSRNSKIILVRPPIKKQKPPYPINLYLKKITELSKINKNVKNNKNLFVFARKKKIMYINISTETDHEDSLNEVPSSKPQFCIRKIFKIKCFKLIFLNNSPLTEI